MQRHRAIPVAVLLLIPAQDAGAQSRTMLPEDLFRVERIGAIAWSSDGARAAVEIARPGRWLGRGIPTAALGLVDAGSASLRTVSPPSRAFVGFFGASWSPNGRRLLFLSIDTNAVIRPWVWTVGTAGPVPLRGLQLRDAAADPPAAIWRDEDHAVLMVRDSAQPNNGPHYFRIMRGRNVATEWSRARAGRVAAVTVFDSRGSSPDTSASLARIVVADVRTGAVTTLATGAVHRPTLSADRRTLTYRRESPAMVAAPASSFFGPEALGDAAYDRPNWGTEVHHIDSRTGAAVPAPSHEPSRPVAAIPAALEAIDDPATGTQLVLSRPNRPDTVIWRGNEWVKAITPGTAEPVRYTSRDGRPLTGWILYPPGRVPGRRIPIVTVVYPSRVYGERTPGAFSLFDDSFEHPQVFAALGYGVVLPSMPEPEFPLRARGLDSLSPGVLPLLDTLIARGVADSTRIAVLGQSAGGYATLGLITETHRFRTAIASASYANLPALYGAFYGQYRYGDGGSAQRAQVLRMLQMERGYFGAAGPPWEHPDRYRENSPIERVANVRTPLLLIHGDSDFIPVQQAEEFFTALYRQDKRVRLVRYAGEGHTISGRANVLDMWRRIQEWLRETMP